MPGATGMLGTMLGPAVIINWSAPNGKTQMKTINTKAVTDLFAFLATREVTRQAKRDSGVFRQRNALYHLSNRHYLQVALIQRANDPGLLNNDNNYIVIIVFPWI